MPKYTILASLLFTLFIIQIGNTQEVGVGLTNPSAQLHVKPAIGLIPMRVDNSNGIGILHVLNSQRVAIGADANEGTFNVTGTTFLTDELTIRNATLAGNNILRFWKYQDNGVLDIYDGNSIINRINAKGTSYFNGGFIGLNITAPTARLDINGDLRVRNIPAGSAASDEVLTVDATGFMRKVPVSALGGGSGTGDITGVTAAGGLTGGGTSGNVVIAANADNGLNVNASADKIQLGGTLIKATTIDHGIYTLTHNLNSSGDFQIADNGVMKFSVLDNGRVAVNGTNTAGQFNVTGDSYYSDDIYLRDGNVTGTNLLRLFDNGDEGVIDWYNAGSVQNRITAQGSSYINGGNFGIGTTSPSEKLHVQGNMRVSALAGSGNRMVVADANGALSTQAIPSGGGSGTGDIDGVNAGAGVSGGGTTGTVTINALANNGLNVDASADRIQLGGALTEQTTIFQSNNDMNWDLTGTGDFKINDSGITKFAVNDNGRVSVGSNVTEGAFNVTGTSYFSQPIYMRQGTVSGPPVLFLGDALPGKGVAFLYDNGNPTTCINSTDESYFNGGILSVGTTAGPGLFNVQGTSYFSNDIYLRDGTVASGDILARLYDSNDDGVFDLYENNTVTTRLRGNGTSYILGDLCVGATSSGARFRVTGSSSDAYAVSIGHSHSTPFGGGLQVSTSTSTNNEHSAAVFSAKSFASQANAPTLVTASKSFVNEGYADSKVGIQIQVLSEKFNNYSYALLAQDFITSTGSPGSGVRYAGYFQGSIFVTGSYLPSHSSLKNNINLLDTGLPRLMKIQVKEYEYKKKGLQHMNLPEGTQTGVIAEELKEIYPELVKRTIQPEIEEIGAKEIEFEAVNYTGLVPHLIKGMQEQQAMIEEFEKKEAIQNEKIERLEKLVDQLINAQNDQSPMNNN